MGNCSSNDSTRVATAKLVLQDGQLQEFSYPVKVSCVLQKYPMCFICNSDEMEFDNVVRAIDEDEELQPGQLYFALPLNRLRHRLQAEEMAALAVKANSALMRSGGGEKRGYRRKPIVFFNDENAKSCKKVSPGIGGADGGNRRRRGRCRAGGGGKFEAMLSAIPE